MVATEITQTKLGANFLIRFRYHSRSGVVMDKTPMETIDLSVIVVNRNTRALLRDCLLSLHQEGNNQNREIWVVDNASDDGSAAMVRSDFPHIHLIVNDENVGFARANNQALAQAKGPFYLLLNPDTVVPSGTLDRLLAFMEEAPGAGIVGCGQVYPDGEWQVTSHREPTLGREALVALGLARVLRVLIDYGIGPQEHAAPRQVDWVEGGALLIRDTALAAVSQLDEAFYMYVEDADLCLRVRQAGFEVYFVPSIHIIHYRGQSTGLEQREQRRPRVNAELLEAFHRSKAHYFHKHGSSFQAQVYWLLVRVYSLRKLCMGLVAYLLRRLERDAWQGIRGAYLSLMKSGSRAGSAQSTRSVSQMKR